jgi:PAS domain S-box-containing protein
MASVIHDIPFKRIAKPPVDGERPFAELLDALPAAIYTTDAQGRLTGFNSACVALSGRTPQLGTDHWCVTWKLFYPDGRPMPHDQCPMAIALKEGRVVRGAEAIAERPNGTRIWFEPHPTPLFDDAGRVVGGINMLVDITARKEAEQALHANEQRLAAELEASAVLHSVSTELVRDAGDEQTVYQRIMDAAVAIMGSQYASMQRLYPERGTGGELRLLAFRGFDPEAARFWEWVRTDSSCTCGVALKTRRRSIATDVRSCEFMAGTPDQATYLAAGILAVQSTPLLSRSGELIGMISTHWDHPHYPSERDWRLFDLLARQAADLIERHQAQEQVAEDLAAMRCLHEVGARCALADCDIQECLGAIVEAAIRLTGADKGNIQLYDRATGALVLTAHRGFDEPFLEFFASVSDKESACGSAMQRGERVVVEDVAASLIFQGTTAQGVMLGAGARAVQSTPLVSSAGHLLGMISTHWSRPHRPSASALARLDLLARQAADFLERKQTEQAVRDRQIWLDGQREALETAVNGAPLETSLGILVRTAVEAVGRDARAGFYLANDEGTALRHVVGMPADYAEAVDGFKVGPDSLACGLATATGKPVLTADVRNEPLWQPWLWMAEKFDYRACWSFPIHTAARKFVGTLAVYSRQPREATPRDQELGALLTHTASIIISRHQESQVRKQAEQALRASEERFRSLVSVLADVPWTTDADGRFVTPQEAYARYTGKSWEELRGDGWAECIHPDDRGELLRTWQRAVATRSTYDFECRQWHGPTQAWRWVRARGTPVENADGSIREWVGSLTDIDDQKRGHARLQESEKRFRMVADNMAQLAWTCDTLGNVTWYNRRWLEYTGLSFEEMKGWDWSKVQHPDHLARVVARVKHSADTGEPWEDTFPLRGKDGVYRWFLSRALPIQDEAGRVVSWFGTNTDIDEQVQAEESLRQAHRRKDEYLAMLAHELRNPLAAVSNAIGVLQQSDTDPASARSATLILARQARHMVRQVDDLLDVSRISRGAIELRRERIELAQVVNQAVETVRPICENLQHELTVTLPPRPIAVHGDPVRLAQVVGNLLNNACKFTDRGGRIRLAIEEDGEQAVIRVRDTGIGIAAGELSRIFEIFAQVDTSLERSREGLGLGLALVKSLVEMHGGSVEAKSAGIGQGSEFVVRLPLAPGLPSAPPPAARPVPSSDKPPATACRRVLVVDDNRDAAKSLAMLLKLMGHQVDTAHDGLEGVARAATFRADIILLDIGMPGLNGYEAARRIRQQNGHPAPKLVALTGWGQEEDRRRSAEAGFDAHLVKPVDVAALTRLVEE